MMDQLRQLLRRFVSGEVAYREFRQEFGRFFAEGDADLAIGNICLLVESECSAYEHGIINIDGLKLGLQIQVLVAGGVSSTVANEVTITFNPPEQEQPMVWTNSAENRVMTQPIAA